ncbi:MAG: DMT family transporter [Bacteroidetes bacterium]|nr:DMT family transporter [Bacteroidota bacterium]
MNRKLLSWSALLACNFMWSLQFLCIKLVQDQVGALCTVFIPVFIATVFMLPFVWKDLRSKKGIWKHLRIFALLAIVGQFPAQILMTYGTQLSTASNAGIISLTLPIVSASLAVIFLKEKMTTGRWLCFGIAIVGVILCSLKDIHNINTGWSYMLGNLLIFSGVAGSAFYNTICKKIANDFTEMEMLFYTYIFLVAILLPLVLFYERDIIHRIPDFTRNTWTGLILLTVFHNFLSMILFFTALKKLEAIQVALSNFLITFFALPIAAIFLKEVLSPVAIVGGTLVLISTLLITIVEYRNSTQMAKPSLRKV